MLSVEHTLTLEHVHAFAGAHGHVFSKACVSFTHPHVHWNSLPVSLTDGIPEAGRWVGRQKHHCLLTKKTSIIWVWLHQPVSV